MSQPISTFEKIKELLRLKVRFALTSSIATGLDYVLYLVLVHWFFSPVVSNIISYSSAALMNFWMQKRFIFELNRKVQNVFLMTMTISVGGLLLSTLIIYLLNLFPFFQQYQFVTKLLTTGIIFFYNFYLKRFAFEGRFV
ncbi:MAG TPA: GtrA family protein [Saprospiraceae bacterium]|nr:GtrA family protein [Saprospiraceae bacterium]